MALVVGIVVGRLTAPQKETAIHWAMLIRSVAKKLAEKNPERDATDVAAEVVDLVCDELGAPEADDVKVVATASANISSRTKSVG